MTVVSKEAAFSNLGMDVKFWTLTEGRTVLTSKNFKYYNGVFVGDVNHHKQPSMVTADGKESVNIPDIFLDRAEAIEQMK